MKKQKRIYIEIPLFTLQIYFSALAICIFLFLLYFIFVLQLNSPGESGILPTRMVIKRVIIPLTHPNEKRYALEKTFTNSGEIKKLYFALLVTPTEPILKGKLKEIQQLCNGPALNDTQYTMDFYQSNTNMLHAIFDQAGCWYLKIYHTNGFVNVVPNGSISDELNKLFLE